LCVHEKLVYDPEMYFDSEENEIFTLVDSQEWKSLVEELVLFFCFVLFCFCFCFFVLLVFFFCFALF